MEKAVDFTRLEKNIIEVIQEEQIKLGYRSELIRLYYPITSLNRFFHTDAAEKEMSELLADCENAGMTLKDIIDMVRVLGEK